MSTPLHITRHASDRAVERLAVPSAAAAAAHIAAKLARPHLVRFRGRHVIHHCDGEVYVIADATQAGERVVVTVWPESNDDDGGTAA